MPEYRPVGRNAFINKAVVAAGSIGYTTNSSTLVYTGIGASLTPRLTGVFQILAEQEYSLGGGTITTIDLAIIRSPSNTSVAQGSAAPGDGVVDDEFIPTMPSWLSSSTPWKHMWVERVPTVGKITLGTTVWIGFFFAVSGTTPQLHVNNEGWSYEEV